MRMGTQLRGFVSFLFTAEDTTSALFFFRYLLGKPFVEGAPRQCPP
jgi:hypothetical protein